MADQLQLRGGTTVEHSTFTGALREVTVDIDKDTVVVHDNTTAGGHPLAKEDLSNVSGTDAASKLNNQTVAFSGGAAATPSVTFDGDTNTGIYSPGADQVAISTGGTGRLFVDSSGRLGLGDSSPDFKLDVNGDIGIREDNNLTFHDGTGTAAFRIRGGSDNKLYFERASGHESQMVIDDGKVGVGTTTVSAALDVRGADNVVIGASPQSGNGEGVLFLGCVGTGTKGTIIGRSALSFQTSSDSTPVSSGTERMRIDSSGRLLVGTSSARSNIQISTGFGSVTPNHQFETSASTYTGLSVINNDTNYPAVFSLGKSRSAGGIGSNGIVANGDIVGMISFYGNDDSKFVRAATISAEVDGTPGANDMPGRLVFSTTADGASSPTERMRVSSTGKVYIGTPIDIRGSTNESLEISNTNTGTGIVVSNDAANAAGIIHQTTSPVTAYAQFIGYWENYSGAGVGSITHNQSSTSYNTTSDYRLKENIIPLAGATERLKLLSVHRFNFIANPDRTVDGFLAHEVQTVVPEAITGEKDKVDDDGNPVYQGIDQSKLVPLLTAALQEAIGRIETLEAEVAALKA